MTDSERHFVERGGYTNQRLGAITWDDMSRHFHERTPAGAYPTLAHPICTKQKPAAASMHRFFAANLGGRQAKQDRRSEFGATTSFEIGGQTLKSLVWVPILWHPHRCV